MTKPWEDLIAALPQSLEPEFVMASPDEPIRLATGVGREITKFLCPGREVK